MPGTCFTTELHPKALGLWILTIHEVVVTTVAQGRNTSMVILLSQLVPLLLTNPLHLTPGNQQSVSCL